MKQIEQLYKENFGNLTGCDVRNDITQWQLYQVDYKQVYTPILMRWFKECRRYSFSPNYYEDEVTKERFWVAHYYGKRFAVRKEAFDHLEIKCHHVFEALKKELSTREHIPNKQERKKIRQDNARK